MAPEDRIDGLYTDRYQLAMAYAYWSDGRAEDEAAFDYFFRKLPFEGGYVVFAGLPSLFELMESFRFQDDQLAFLEKEGFAPAFLDELSTFRFTGAIHAPPEGEIVFPTEPVARIEGNLLETQLLETLFLNVINFQSLIATKACRCRYAAGERLLSEFGLRRAHGLAGRWAARAAMVGGFDSTSNLDAARRYDLPSAGTMAHSFVQSYDREIDAFRAFAESHGSATVLLLDTYDTMESGLPNAIAVAREMRQSGESLKGVRLDSGDLAYLSQKVRARLDDEGLEDVKIVASNQIDERVIRSLSEQDAPIDLFGIGTYLATGAPDASLDGVYKLSFASGKPRMKFSDSLSKATLPGKKAVRRFFDEDGQFAADAIYGLDESVPNLMIHPSESSRRLELDPERSEPLLRLSYKDGKPTEAPPSASQSAKRLAQRLEQLPKEHKRTENPHTYKIGISQPLHDLRSDILDNFKQKE